MKQMRRFSLLGVVLLALVASGCLGVGSSEAPAKKTAVVIRWANSGVDGDVLRRYVFYVSCPVSSGLKSEVVACNQLIGHPDRYFGAPAVTVVATMPVRGESVSVRGTVDGSPVKQFYGPGAKPQYPWWIRLLTVLKA
jgi:hypothetical protein